MNNNLEVKFSFKLNNCTHSNQTSINSYKAVNQLKRSDAFVQCRHQVSLGRPSPGGHQVVVVVHLDEGLDLGPLGNLLLAHGGGHLAGVPVDAGDKRVAVGSVGGTVIDVLQGGDGLDTCLFVYMGGGKGSNLNTLHQNAAVYCTFKQYGNKSPNKRKHYWERILNKVTIVLNAIYISAA